MNRLAPNLFDRRFADFMDLARSRLPALAPDWTDYNAHDPGITLLELLAWVAEAQLYALGCDRRDERENFAALMGLAPHGPRAARGLIWPDHGDAEAQAALRYPRLIGRDALVHVLDMPAPAFSPTHAIVLAPLRIASLKSHLARCEVIDQTVANARGRLAFMPFGLSAGPHDVLRMNFEPLGGTPLLPPEPLDDACLAIGVRIDGAPDAPRDHDAHAAAIEATLVTRDARRSLRVVEDTTGGFLHTGAVLLDVSGIARDTQPLALEFRAPRGFERAPAILHIEPGVVPVEQGRVIGRELHIAQGIPCEYFDLERAGLAFEPGEAPVVLEVADVGAFPAWRQVMRLADHGPEDRVFSLDPVTGRVSIGNGVNGRLLPAGAQVFASYRVNDGELGNVARNRRWIAPGFIGAIGVNPDAVAGGAARSGPRDDQLAARRSAQNAHPLVSADDIERATCALPGLGVGRAWLIPASTDALTLVAMQTRTGGVEPAAIPETPRWLEAVRRRLAPRIPLGARLAVVAPRYAQFGVVCRIEAAPERDPAAVVRAVEAALRERGSLVGDTPVAPERPFGLPLTRRDVVAWLQTLPEVRRVQALRLVTVGGAVVDEVKVARHGLPRIDFSLSSIEAVRAAGGRQ
ncbi:putative baseplate assembly protein (plasmid) [Burkholderia sp. THE68]|uniref:putative baseplate assembly protein n=1 Tax=Burkholderia sp. THE68 TaxID=758782 RepID=UPI0013185318|nr:putative baseplate assembly protein [Burkholderia sp. THE68]BBU33473.1 putative baseplate assembly protein [Burkholderia sp. THE68]